MYTIVIADDEQRICDAIKAVITSAMPELEIAGIFSDGEELYNYLLNNHADIVLTDIEMPGKNGLEVTRLIEEQAHRSYVIIITAYHEFEYAKKAIEYRADSFLTKPFSSQQLVHEIQKGIAYFARKKNEVNEHRAVNRGLLQMLYENKVNLPAYENIRLCQDSVYLKDLKCTELVIESECLNMLSKEREDDMVRELIDGGECDDCNQSVFFINKKATSITFMVFSRDEHLHEENTLSDILRIVERHTGDKASPYTKTFDSFSSYLIYLVFSKEMDNCFKVYANSGLYPANEQMHSFLLTLSDADLKLFTDFLTENYHVASTVTDMESLMQSVEKLLNQSAENRSGSYIVDMACDYVRRNLSSTTLQLQTVAEALAVSSVYLSRIFKNKTGQNFSEYLLTIRMEQAQYLLRTTTLSTNEIALAVGYANPTYFRISFKSRFGITPRQYRYNRLGGNMQ